MKRFGFITNKYVLSVLVLLCLFLADAVLHRDISRAIIPSSFSDKIMPVNLPVCTAQLLSKDKNWIKAVNDIELMNKLPANTPGIECDVYFELARNHFEVYSDSSAVSTLNVDSLLSVYASRKMSANTWFSIHNLEEENATASLNEIIRLKNKYGLSGRIIIESSQARFLKAFCDSGFFTTYRIPTFNPYKATENEMILFADSVRKSLSEYPASAVSAYYFQYPALKKFFPNYPILTWIDHTSLSVVSYVFKRQLEHDERIKIILSPFKE